MRRIWSVELPRHIGERVVLAGWLLRVRRLSNLSFLILRDGPGLAQVVLDAPHLVACVASVEPESVLRVEGQVVANQQAPHGVELVATRVEVISAAVEPPPFELHRPHIPAQLPTLLDHAPVALRLRD